MRTLLVSLLVAAACSSPRKPTTVAHAPAPKPKPYPAALYAGLFQTGARYTYDVTASSTYWDDQDPRADASGNVEEHFSGSMTCTVTDVHDVPSAIASRFECEDNSMQPLIGAGPEGIYVATAEGLWRVAEMPRIAPTTTDDRLFPWPLVASDVQTPDPQHPGWGTRISVSEYAIGVWCRYFTFVSGDDGDENICLRDGAVISGSKSSSGATSYEMSYRLAKQ